MKIELQQVGVLCSVRRTMSQEAINIVRYKQRAFGGRFLSQSLYPRKALNHSTINRKRRSLAISIASSPAILEHGIEGHGLDIHRARCDTLR